MDYIRYIKIRRINRRLSACLGEARKQVLICGFCSFFFLCFPGFIYSGAKTEKDSLNKLLNRNLDLNPKENGLSGTTFFPKKMVPGNRYSGHNNFAVQLRSPWLHSEQGEYILRNEYPYKREELPISRVNRILDDIKAESFPKKNLSLLIPVIEEKYFRKTPAGPGEKILSIKAFAPNLLPILKNKKSEKKREKNTTKEVSKIIPVKSVDLSSQIIGPFWRKKFDLAKIKKNNQLKTEKKKVRSSGEERNYEILDLTGTSPQKEELIKRSSKSLPQDLYELNSIDSPFLTKSAKLFQKSRHATQGKFYELKVLFKNRQFRKAIKIVDSFSPGMQNFVKALFMKSQSYEYLQKYSEAIVSYLELSRKFSDNPLADDSLQAAALLYKKRGNVVGAVGLLVEILQQYPKGNKVDSALFFLGLIHEKSQGRQNWKLAESFYKEVINRSGKNKKAASPFVRKSQMALLRLKQE